MSESFRVEGRSYLASLTGHTHRARPIFFEVRRHELPSVGVMVGSMKLIRWQRSGAEALFSLQVDPLEQHNLANRPQYQDGLRDLRRLLDQFESEHHEVDYGHQTDRDGHAGWLNSRDRRREAACRTCP
jgi:hypothetical protein